MNVLKEIKEAPHAAQGKDLNSINMILDVLVPVSLQLGTTVLAIKDILNLKEGSIVELKRTAGEPVDLYINSKLIARGEVTVIADNLGVRITQLLSPEERLKEL